MLFRSVSQSRYRGSWGEAFHFWKNSNVTEEDMLNAVSATHVIPVLTAHPTEAKRVTVIELHRELYLLLVKKENTSLSKLEQNEIKEKRRADETSQQSNATNRHVIARVNVWHDGETFQTIEG